MKLELKRCSKCGIEKPNTNDYFYFKDKKIGRLDAKCKECYKQKYQNNKDKIREYQKEYYNKNKDMFREKYANNKDKIKEYRKEYYEKNKEYYKEYYNNNKENIKKLTKNTMKIIKIYFMPKGQNIELQNWVMEDHIQ